MTDTNAFIGWLKYIAKYAPPKGQVTVPGTFLAMTCGCTRHAVPKVPGAQPRSAAGGAYSGMQVDEEFRLRPIPKTGKNEWEHIGCSTGTRIVLWPEEKA